MNGLPRFRQGRVDYFEARTSKTDPLKEMVYAIFAVDVDRGIAIERLCIQAYG
jgi:hypothetical protein